MTDPKGPREDRWYLSLMSPNTKGPQFAWLDPTSIYINAAAFGDLLDDLCADLDAAEVDVVGGLDAMGFVLGSALGVRLGRGFLPIRKAGKLCVDTDRVSFTNYSGRTQDMEMRQPAFAPGTRVLLVDQWVETGGTMDGAIRLVERQGGTVAGIVAIAMERNPATDALKARFKVVTAVTPGSHWQEECDAQELASFARYTPERTFPTAGRTPSPCPAAAPFRGPPRAECPSAAPVRTIRHPPCRTVRALTLLLSGRQSLGLDPAHPGRGRRLPIDGAVAGPDVDMMSANSDGRFAHKHGMPYGDR